MEPVAVDVLDLADRRAAREQELVVGPRLRVPGPAGDRGRAGPALRRELVRARAVQGPRCRDRHVHRDEALEPRTRTATTAAARPPPGPYLQRRLPTVAVVVVVLLLVGARTVGLDAETDAANEVGEDAAPLAAAGVLEADDGHAVAAEAAAPAGSAVLERQPPLALQVRVARRAHVVVPRKRRGRGRVREHVAHARGAVVPRLRRRDRRPAHVARRREGEGTEVPDPHRVRARQ